MRLRLAETVSLWAIKADNLHEGISIVNAKLAAPNNKYFVANGLNGGDLLIGQIEEWLLHVFERIELNSILVKVLEEVLLGKGVEAVFPVLDSFALSLAKRILEQHS